MDTFKGILAIVIGFPLMVVFVVYFVVIAFLPIDYYMNCREAEMYNSVNNTQYTCWDFYWAGDQINSQTQTINLNQ